MRENNVNETLPAESYLSDVCRRFSMHKPAMIGLMVLLAEILLVIFLPVVMNLDQSTTDYSVAFGSPPSASGFLNTFVVEALN